jgi:hypothetical protein
MIFIDFGFCEIIVHQYEIIILIIDVILNLHGFDGVKQSWLSVVIKSVILWTLSIQWFFLLTHKPFDLPCFTTHRH